MEDIYELTFVDSESNKIEKVRISKSKLKEIVAESYFNMARASLAIEGEKVDDLNFEDFKDLIEVPDELLTF